MLGLRCRFSTLDLRSRFDTPNKSLILLTQRFTGLIPRFKGATS